MIHVRVFLVYVYQKIGSNDEMKKKFDNTLRWIAVIQFHGQRNRKTYKTSCERDTKNMFEYQLACSSGK